MPSARFLTSYTSPHDRIPSFPAFDSLHRSLLPHRITSHISDSPHRILYPLYIRSPASLHLPHPFIFVHHASRRPPRTPHPVIHRYVIRPAVMTTLESTQFSQGGRASGRMDSERGSAGAVVKYDSSSLQCKSRSRYHHGTWQLEVSLTPRRISLSDTLESFALTPNICNRLFNLRKAYFAPGWRLAMVSDFEIRTTLVCASRLHQALVVSAESESEDTIDEIYTCLG